MEMILIFSTKGQYCYRNAMIINKKDLQPGDLIFYSHEDNGQFQNISHVAIYVVMERWFMRRNQREVWY